MQERTQRGYKTRQQPSPHRQANAAHATLNTPHMRKKQATTNKQTDLDVVPAVEHWCHEAEVVSHFTARLCNVQEVHTGGHLQAADGGIGCKELL